MGGPGLDEEKLARFRDSSYFRVEVSILCGRDLIAMDRGGTSDPYVQASCNRLCWSLRVGSG